MVPLLFVHPDKFSQIQAAEHQLEVTMLRRAHPDVLWVEPEKDGKVLGVKDAKLIRNHFLLKPLQARGKVVVIILAGCLSVEAQNSLLKTLEELPEDAQIIMTASSDSDLLPTIISRSRVTHLTQDASLLASNNSETLEKYADKIRKLPGLSPEERFTVIEQTEDKEALLQALIQTYTQKLRQDSKYVAFAKELIQAEEYKQASGNVRTILEYLMLLLPTG